MGIRETLNKNPALTTGGTIAIIVLALIFIVFEMLPNRPAKISNKVYFSDDDGATYFAYDATKVPPFTDEKHTNAVRCYVYTCNGGKPFVGYLEKYSDAAKAQMFDANGQRTMRPSEMRDTPGRLVKLPLKGEWLDTVDDRDDARDITNVKCPDGKPESLKLIPAS